jgi:hypothetical protein
MGRIYGCLALASVVVAAGACSKSSGALDAEVIGVCGDTVDNDGDGSTDYPADPGCDSLADNDESNPPIAACSDGRDNDDDGKTDFPADPGCYSPLQASELDDCPTGKDCPACSNGIDDEGDGLIDYPQDPGCPTASEGDEFEVNPVACGNNLTVTLLPETSVIGMLAGSPSTLTSETCGGGGGEVPYQISLTVPRIMIARTDVPTTTVDTVLYLRQNCLEPTSELACNDDSGTPGAIGSAITRMLDIGTYYLIVDARNAGQGGSFTLDVQFLLTEGQPCTQQAECGPGLQCRIPEGETEMVCAQPNCTDPADADGDGDGAYPDDPGCTDPIDFDETDDCPSGPTCPVCANGLDDDGDGFIDYPADPQCEAASGALEAICPAETTPITTITMPTYTGSTAGGANNFTSCAGIGSEDRTFALNLPVPVQQLVVDTAGSTFDTVLSITNSACTVLACNDDAIGLQSQLIMTNLAAGAYGIIIDGYSTTGNYTLNVAGTVAAGNACTSPLFAAGVLACASGTCTAGTCQ